MQLLWATIKYMTYKKNVFLFGCCKEEPHFTTTVEISKIWRQSIFRASLLELRHQKYQIHSKQYAHSIKFIFDSISNLMIYRDEFIICFVSRRRRFSSELCVPFILCSMFFLFSVHCAVVVRIGPFLFFIWIFCHCFISNVISLNA